MCEETQMTRAAFSAESVRSYTPWESVARLVSYMRPYKRLALVSLVFSLTGSGLFVARPYLIKLAVDNHIATGNLKGLGGIIITFAGLLILKYLSDYCLNFFTGILGQKVMHDLRMHVFGHILSMVMRFFVPQPGWTAHDRTTTT